MAFVIEPRVSLRRDERRRAVRRTSRWASKHSLLEKVPAPVPQHIAIIPDGNGRWAEKRSLPRLAGHAAGSETLQNIVRLCLNAKILEVTVFVCSTENMMRNEAEVSGLMELIEAAVKKLVAVQHVAVRWIGNSDRLPDSLQEILRSACQESTEQGEEPRLQLNLAVDYGGRDEIASVARRLAEDVSSGLIKAEDVNEETFDKYVREISIGDPDLVIRTGGEKRISNFLLWQNAYSELYFTNILWPDFNADELLTALTWYSNRQRRFGLVNPVENMSV